MHVRPPNSKLVIKLYKIRTYNIKLLLKASPRIKKGKEKKIASEAGGVILILNWKGPPKARTGKYHRPNAVWPRRYRYRYVLNPSLLLHPLLPKFSTVHNGTELLSYPSASE